MFLLGAQGFGFRLPASCGQPPARLRAPGASLRRINCCKAGALNFLVALRFESLLMRQYSDLMADRRFYSQ